MCKYFQNKGGRVWLAESKDLTEAPEYELSLDEAP